MHIAVLNGPNLNRLGKRRPERYGYETLEDITNDVAETGRQLGIDISHFQSNHEGAIIDWLHERQDNLDAIILNPAGLTPYGRPLQDAISDTGLPLAVVHISQLYLHYGNETQDLFRGLASVYICGLGWRGYSIALERLHIILTTTDTHRS